MSRLLPVIGVGLLSGVGALRSTTEAMGYCQLRIDVEGVDVEEIARVFE